MRTAVVRVDVDPAGELSREQLTAGMATLRTLAEQSGIELVDNNLAVMPRGRREAETADRRRRSGGASAHGDDDVRQRIRHLAQRRDA